MPLRNARSIQLGSQTFARCGATEAVTSNHFFGYIHLTPIVAALLLLLAGCRIPSETDNEQILKRDNSVSKITLSREALLQDDENRIRPFVLERSIDGNFIVGGTSAQAAWAAKIDSKGEMLWKYPASLHDRPSAIGIAGAFHGAAPMPDGTTYLCGVMPHRRGDDGLEALLTHIDANGKLLREDLVGPSDVIGAKITSVAFNTCAQWGDGVVFVGPASRLSQPTSPNVATTLENFYWVLSLDPTGKTKWERLIPRPIGLNATTHLSLLPAGTDLVISNTNTESTDLFRLGSSGEMKAEKRLPGNFRLIRPVVPDSISQLWGYVSGESRSVLITLNDRLEDTHRLEGLPKRSFNAEIIYRLPDKSVCLFGTSKIDNSQVGTTAIVHVNPTLESMQEFHPISPTDVYLDPHTLSAVAPSVQQGNFVAAFMATAAPPHFGLLRSFAALSKPHRGLLVQFIKLN